MNILNGQILLIICFLFYLIWWYRGFRPGSTVSRVKGLNGLLLFITALTGIGGVILSLTGDAPASVMISPFAILTSGIIAYIVLLLVTRFLFNRIVTSELFLIVAWTTLEVWVLNCLDGAGMLSNTRFWVMTTVLAIAFLGSMVCYVLYYRLVGRRAFYVAMIPLIAGIVSMVTMIGLAMTCLCLTPPTPGFLLHRFYTCEPIPGGMVVYDSFAWAGDMMTFREYFEMTGTSTHHREGMYAL